jgi:hypothetical protein
MLGGGGRGRFEVAVSSYVNKKRLQFVVDEILLVGDNARWQETWALDQ